MMTLIFRYVAKEILKCFAIVLTAVLSIYVAVDFIEKVDNFMEAGVPLSRAVVFFLYKLPFIFVQIAPVGFLLSILVVLGLMSKNNEVIALKSCGIGTGRLLRPVFVVGLACCVGLFAVSEMTVPAFMVKANQIWLQEVRKKNIIASETNDIWMRTARQIIHIRQYRPVEKRVSGVTIHTFDDAFTLIHRLDAESGTFEAGRWQLEHVVEQIFQRISGASQFVEHERVTQDLELNPEDLDRVAKKSEEMGLVELGATIEKVEREGYGATRYRVDYHGKIASAFVCLFLSVMGTGIALRGKLREGLPVSITYGLGIAFLYWIFNSFCLSLGYAEMMPPMVAAWTANLVFSCIALFLMLKTT